MARGSSHLAVGVVFALAGAGSLCAGLLHASWLPGSFLTLTGASLASIVGFVLLLGGLLMALFAFQRPEEVAAVVPAEVAFASRMVATTAVLPVPVPAARARPTRPAAAAPPMPAHVAAPADPRRAHVAGIDGQIRELTRRINKAGVMLATGQISQQGYASYVDDLKRQRGALEAKRVELEMRGI